MNTLITQELIQKKRDGMSLDEDEIRDFVAGVTTGKVTDAQIAALAMAICFRGMDLAERTTLTLAMRDSGRVLEWGNLNGPVMDKHSTGGVGDLVSLVLAPLMAACGAYVPMISGRGLGHTGGTLDKLESIPGFDTSPGVSQFQSQVQSLGVAIIGQTGDLAPADRRIYAVRDVTATVDSVPLIVASILSKKLAEGLDGLVMDVKVGSGAFMRDLEGARILASTLTLVSRSAGLPCTSLITDMNFPLAWSAGNSLEVKEAIAYLVGEDRHPRLDDTIRSLCAEMVVLGGLATSNDQAQGMVSRNLDSGLAAEVFSQMVASQGGPKDLIEQPDKYLPAAQFSRPVFPDESGYVAQVDTKSIGFSVVDLGGGRRRAEDRIDPSVGMSQLCMAGQKVGPQEPLAIIHAASKADWKRAEARVRSAIILSDEVVTISPLIREHII